VSELSGLTRRLLLEELAIIVVDLQGPARVAIDGRDAAGKTVLADELAPVVEAHGEAVTRISADDFLRPSEERYRQGRMSPEGYYEDSFDHAALRLAVLEATSPVLVDGVFLLRPELDDLWSLRVLVDVTEAEALTRALERDGPEMEELYRARYLPGQRLYEARVGPRNRADVVVRNDDPSRPRLVMRRGVRRLGA
jgi:uridine kinase